MSTTRQSGSSVSRAASTHPALPPPTIAMSYPVTISAPPAERLWGAPVALDSSETAPGGSALDAPLPDLGVAAVVEILVGAGRDLDLLDAAAPVAQDPAELLGPLLPGELAGVEGHLQDESHPPILPRGGACPLTIMKSGTRRSVGERRVATAAS